MNTDIARRLNWQAASAKGSLFHHRKAYREAENLRGLIQPLYEKGMPGYRIALQLNDWRVGSPGGGRWHAENVYRVLVRLGLREPRAA